VESEAQELDEEIMLGAVLYGHKKMQVVIDTINDLRDTIATPALKWQAPKVDELLIERVKELGKSRLMEGYRIVDKIERRDQVTGICREIAAQLAATGQWSESVIFSALEKLEKSIIRDPILSGSLRIGGRDTKTVRPIDIRLGVLPRAHGSALFTRGETQALVITTLGTERDAQTVDTAMGESKDNFMLHYNFPPYCVGEIGRISSPKRREIGHGQLAKRGIKAVLPGTQNFPYIIRVVSEIMESNGSSSMASVCGTTLALMDAGVPIRSPVAGIAMGLIKEGDKFVVLSDIIGDEDHFGDMDFKVVGSKEGITALQMDIKIDGITREIMEEALAQAKEGRLHILRIMHKAIAMPRKEMSEHAPRIITMRIPTHKKGDVIGKGGVTIRAITEETGSIIDIADDGLVTISSKGMKSGEDARIRIEQIIKDIEVGEVYEGKVMRLLDFGAIVEIAPGKDGLLHISKISSERVERVSDKLQEGQIVKVQVIEMDRQGKMKLSMRF
jgi:polyribonucleotide nucleotidyltransferase